MKPFKASTTAPKAEVTITSEKTKKKKGGILTIKKGSNITSPNTKTSNSMMAPGVNEAEDGNEDYSDDDQEGECEYKQGGYHKVAIGDKFNNRYTVIEKLGWGHFSTVWMCQDKKATSPKYSTVALKIQKSADQYREAALDEIDLFRHIATTLSKPEVARESKLFGFDSCVVQFLHNFDHVGPNGKHTCMVFEVLGENMLSVIKKYNYKGIPVPIVKNIIRQVCLGLDFLHRHCSIIHTDIKPENILTEYLRSVPSSSHTVRSPTTPTPGSSNSGLGLNPPVNDSFRSIVEKSSTPTSVTPLALGFSSLLSQSTVPPSAPSSASEVDSAIEVTGGHHGVLVTGTEPSSRLDNMLSKGAEELTLDVGSETLQTKQTDSAPVAMPQAVPVTSIDHHNVTTVGNFSHSGKHRGHPFKAIHKNEHDDDISPIRRLNSRHDVHSLQDLFRRNLLSFLNFDIPAVSGPYSSGGTAVGDSFPLTSSNATQNELMMLSSVNHLISPRLKPPAPLVYIDAAPSHPLTASAWVSDFKVHIPFVSKSFTTKMKICSSQ